MTGTSTGPSSDDRERYGRIFHEQGRLTVNAEREKPFAVDPWEDRTGEMREIDMRGASAVAVQAVHDAGLSLDACRKRVMQLEARFREFAAEAHRRKWLYENFHPEAFDALHQLGNEMLAAIGADEEGAGNG